MAKFRNRAFAIIAVILTLFFFSLAPGNLAAQTVIELQPGFYCAGIPSNQFEMLAAPDTAGKQRQSNWCWAAVIQMILNYHGVDITQEQIVSHVFGDLVDSPATPQEVISSISGWSILSNGKPVTVVASTNITSGSDIVYDLAYHQPMIVGLNTNEGIGHACVLTAISYTLHPISNEPMIKSVVLRDPWPQKQSRIEMSWDEFFNRLIFMARIRVNGDLLDYQ